MQFSFKILVEQECQEYTCKCGKGLAPKTLIFHKIQHFNKIFFNFDFVNYKWNKFKWLDSEKGALSEYKTVEFLDIQRFSVEV